MYGGGAWPHYSAYQRNELASNGNYYEPDAIAVRHGICGDPEQVRCIIQYNAILQYRTYGIGACPRKLCYRIPCTAINICPSAIDMTQCISLEYVTATDLVIVPLQKNYSTVRATFR